VTLDDRPALQAGRDYGELRRNAIGLPSALAMSLAYISPTIGVIFITALIAGKAGVAAPFTFIIGTIGIAFMALTLAHFSVRVPSAGTFYTFISQGLGPSTGFVMGWLLFFAYALQSPINTNLFGSFVSGLIKANFGVTIPWWLLMGFIIAFVGALAWWSIHRSMQLDLAFVVAEVTIVGALLILILVKGGAQGQVPEAWNPANSPTGLSGIGLAFIFVVFAFFGFESSTTVAEEVRHPRRNLPIALVGSVLLTGIWFCFAMYAIIVGYGPSHVGSLASASAPVTNLATRYIGHWYSTLVSLAAVSAQIAVLIAIHNANYRIFYALGRERLLPALLGRTHPRYQTPHVAIIAYSVVALGLGLMFGLLWTPMGAFGDVGYFSSLGILPIYLMTNIALIVFMWRKHRAEFSWLFHGLFPVIAMAIIIFGIYTSVHPFPASPLNFMPFFVLGWILAGVAWMLYLRSRNPRKLQLIGQILFLDVEPPAAPPGAAAFPRPGENEPEPPAEPTGTEPSPSDRTPS
jgi:amino acid transporter